MMRSLFAGVSGLRNHQTRMDVIGNNIANVNTIGFKAGRVNFKEMFASTLRGATRATERTSGTNPMQLGLGMDIAAIDTLFSQGSLESTGRLTDLAIDGDGFFVLRSGNTTYFTRAGSFGFDADGRLVDTTTGWTVQGKLADATGAIPAGAEIQDINIPFGMVIPAQATSQISYAGNLDASAQPVGTITRTNSLLAIEKAGDNTPLSDLFARGQANAFIKGLVSGVTTFTVNDGTISKTYTYVDNDTAVGNGLFTSLEDLMAEINHDFTSFGAALNANGAVEMTDLSGAAHTLTFESNNPTLQSAFAGANGVVDGTTGLTTASDEFSHYAKDTELLVNLRNAFGESLGLANNNTIDIRALVGGNPVTSSLTVNAATSTLTDLLAAMNTALSIQNVSALSVAENGAIVVQGDPGTANAIESLQISSSANSVFNAAFGFNEQQKARDVTHSASITVFDALGNEHVVTLTFTKTETPNQWTWSASAGGGEALLSGNSGTVTFNADGSLDSFMFDDGSAALQLDPNTGADPLSIELLPGTSGSFDGLTQFAGRSSVIANNQDGYGRGELEEVKIDLAGQISGVFSNGVSRTLAQLSLAMFNNPAGLTKAGNNAFVSSANSGVAIYGEAGDLIPAAIVSGALEMSNVDLATEFANMIIAQRGFQANSRVITTSDEMLTEVVNLKR